MESDKDESRRYEERDGEVGMDGLITRYVIDECDCVYEFVCAAVAPHTIALVRHDPVKQLRLYI